MPIPSLEVPNHGGQEHIGPNVTGGCWAGYIGAVDGVRLGFVTRAQSPDASWTLIAIMAPTLETYTHTHTHDPRARDTLCLNPEI